MMTNLENETALWKSCFIGNFQLADFIITEADRLGILPLIIDKRDCLSRTPLYAVCFRGYQSKQASVHQQHKQNSIRAQIV